MASAKEFVQSPSIEVLETFKKDMLMQIAQELQLEVKRSTRKHELKRLIVEQLVDEDVLPDSCLEVYKPLPMEPSGQYEIRRLEIERELRLKELEAQQRKEELEAQQRKEELEAQQRKEELEAQQRKEELEAQKEERALKHEREMRALELNARRIAHEESIATKFDLGKNVRLVPPFNESEVDKYFQHFERVAQNLKWPIDQWPLLLQSVLRGKAQEAYTTLPISECVDYNSVKNAILKAYELVPEAYRQKFRNYRKQESQTHVEFAHEKEVYFDRWCNSREVGTDSEKLRQVILIEEFKRCVRDDIKTYLDEQKVENLAKAAAYADDYALTHKSTFNKNKSFGPAKKSYPEIGKKSENVAPEKSSDKGQTSNQTMSKDRKPRSFAPVCHYCKKPGHVMSDCWLLKKRREKEATPNAFVSSKSNWRSNPNRAESSIGLDKSEIIREEFKPFVSEGFVSLESSSSQVPIKILRDTGATQSLLLEGVLPLSVSTSTGESVIAQGIEGGCVNVPLHKVKLVSDLVTGSVVVGTRPTLPIKGVSLLLGNDLAGGKVVADPKVTSKPITLVSTEKLEEVIPGIFPSCAVTRAMAKKAQEEPKDCKQSTDVLVDLSDTFLNNYDHDVQNSSDTNPKARVDSEKQDSIDCQDVSLSKSKLISEQENDPELAPLFKLVLPPVELDKIPVGYYVRNGVLMRKWRPPNIPASEEWSVVHQIVVPKVYQREILKLAHESPMGGHLGINKTYNKITKHFYWPQIRHCVAEFCKTCHICQMVGKPNQKIPVAPLKPIPAFEEPFSKVIIDCVGPLPKTKSRNQYLLTIMCASTRFPEAIPLTNITAPKISKALVNFFTLVGLPKEIQSDQGSNFMSGLFQQVVFQLGAKQIKSSAYHPESQGALERFHSTLKNMIRTYCLDNEKDWDEGISLLLFAVRESVQESLGFSPFELVFGHSVRGPLKLLKENWLSENTESLNLLDYVSKFRDKLKKACELAQQNLKTSQSKMKMLYDRKSQNCIFKPGDKVLVLLPVQGNTLQTRYHGPYKVLKRVGDLDYIIETPDRRKSTQLCHVNMVKPYFERGVKKPVMLTDCNIESNSNQEHEIWDDTPDLDVECKIRLSNSEILDDLETKLSHVPPDKRVPLIATALARDRNI